MKPRFSVAGAAVTVAAVLAVIAGLFVIGKPSNARERRLDVLRVDDLSLLSSAIETYWKKHSDFPPTLDTLVIVRQLDKIPTDPQTEASYTYLVSGARSYRLCGTFAQPSDTIERSYVASYDGTSSTHSWRHGAGESCFDLTPLEKDKKAP